MLFLQKSVVQSPAAAWHRLGRFGTTWFWESQDKITTLVTHVLMRCTIFKCPCRWQAYQLSQRLLVTDVCCAGPKSRALLQGTGLEELAELAKPPELQKTEPEVQLHFHLANKLKARTLMQC